MKSGIKKRLVTSYLVLICITVLLFEVFLFATVRFYYHDNIKNTFINQGIIFSNFYHEFLTNNPIDSYAEKMLNEYSFITEAQVQIVDRDGFILADSHYKLSKNVMEFSDVHLGLKGEATGWTGRAGSENESILAVSYPLRANGEIIGVIRFITSLVAVQEQLDMILMYLIILGMIVIAIAAIVSYFLVNSITKPIKVMNEAAYKLAGGNFQVRIEKTKNDELGELAATLNFMASEVEKHEQLKNEFIASISHELRTPLTSLKGWGITLREVTKDPFLSEGLGIITNETERLNALVHDLLDFSSLSAGKMSMKKEKLHLNLVVEQVYLQMKTRAERLKINFILDINESIPLIAADSNRLKQVLINLIDNSFKFTAEDGTVSITIVKMDSFVQLSIGDTGKGIPEQELELITGKFYKGRSNHGGMGLGLAICKEIIDAHGGNMQIISTVGVGTTVQIQLPL
ncbi:HAMP domain-containing histidine kinase [bacterium LRH843]|nr:HAMP domain-containing histidine kinase [bacterium LRH843]